MLKGRNWAFVMYPESMPQDWYYILQNTGLPMAISPLHDKDVNPDGVPKKPHYHVICYYNNTTTQKNVKENVCDLVNATLPIKLESMQGMYRYHLHLDNPEKHQYDDRQRTFINGFDVNKVDALTQTEIDKICLEIHQIIIDKKIMEYSQLQEMLKNNEMFEFYKVGKMYATYFKYIIDSRRYKTKQEKIENIKQKAIDLFEL